MFSFLQRTQYEAANARTENGEQTHDALAQQSDSDHAGDVCQNIHATDENLQSIIRYKCNYVQNRPAPTDAQFAFIGTPNIWNTCTRNGLIAAIPFD